MFLQLLWSSFFLLPIFLCPTSPSIARPCCRSSFSTSNSPPLLLLLHELGCSEIFTKSFLKDLIQVYSELFIAHLTLLSHRHHRQKWVCYNMHDHSYCMCQLVQSSIIQVKAGAVLSCTFSRSYIFIAFIIIPSTCIATTSASIQAVLFKITY